jgi:hypothetical protein
MKIHIIVMMFSICVDVYYLIIYPLGTSLQIIQQITIFTLMLKIFDFWKGKFLEAWWCLVNIFDIDVRLGLGIWYILKDAYIQIWMYLCIHMWEHACGNASTYIYKNIYEPICARMWQYAYTFLCICTYKHKYLKIHICIQIHILIYIYMHIYR